VSGPTDSLRSIFFALGANLAIALAKSVGTLLAGSAIEVKALLLGQSADPQALARMRDQPQAQPEVAALYSLLAQQLGGDVMVAVKVRMHPVASDTALVQAINRVERGFRAQFPALRWLFFEPDIDD